MAPEVNGSVSGLARIALTGVAACLAFVLGARCTHASFSATANHATRAGDVYYVATNGSDSNPGTEAQPWRTVQKAADTLVAGDTVYIRTGTYPERVVPLNSGEEGSDIVYAAYPGETVTVDGAGVDVPEWAGLIDLTGRSFIQVSGLRVVNATTNPHNTGILVDTCDHVVIEKNYVANTNDSGIGVWTSTNVTVDGNEVNQVCQALWNECISVGGSNAVEVKNNLVHDCPKEGICTKDGSFNAKVFANEVHHTAAVGFYVDAQDEHTHDIEVFGNISHESPENGFALASEVGGLLENIKVYNNVAYGNGWCGLQVTACCIADHPMSNVQIVNNTFYNNGAGWGGGIYLENPQAQGVVIRNNICSQNLTFQIAVNQDVPVGYYGADHNLIDGFRGDPAEIRGDAYVEGDPLFANAAGADFHIQMGSPAIASGNADGAPPTDMDGVSRGNPPDIGAYEHQGSSTCTLACTAAVPGSAQASESVDFTGTATPSSACTGSVSFNWDFGDGSAHATTAQAQHAYASPGTYAWKLGASVSTASCSKAGVIAINPPVTPPYIRGVGKAGSPFRIKISGSNFQDGVQVFLGGDATPWGNTVRKSDGLLVLKGGASLKARFPSGQAVSIRVLNPDGGQATTTYTRP